MCIARWVHKTRDNDSSNNNNNPNPNTNHPHTQNHTHNHNHHNWIVPTPTSLSLSLILLPPRIILIDPAVPNTCEDVTMPVHWVTFKASWTGDGRCGFRRCFFFSVSFFLESRNHQIDTYKSIDSIIALQLQLHTGKWCMEAWFRSFSGFQLGDL